ncbi:multiple cyclophane-containing RiPP AmcA [Micromonospora coxensis]|uniref:multiple cyclophane-containing RiPP AmcA n=1 Tax=Micromonospora coxensis TaxID=356852 RepID=UPI00341F26C0
MPETMSHRRPERVGGGVADPVADRVRQAATGLTALLREAEAARRSRAEVSGPEGSGAVCAWNHFENIPTFYNWNNRPR